MKLFKSSLLAALVAVTVMWTMLVSVVPLYADTPAPAEATGKWEGAWEITLRHSKAATWIHDGFSLDIAAWDGSVFKGTYCWDNTANGDKSGCSPAEGKMVSPTIMKFKYDADKSATITWDFKKMVASWNGTGPYSNAGLQSPMKKVTEVHTSER
jgi:hypothetical protein